MKALILGTTAAFAFTVGLAAQSATIKRETKVDVKSGKDVTVTGCVEASETGAGYILTHVEPRYGDGPLSIYALVGEESSVGRHLGQLVEIKGKATNIGDDGKVEVTTKTKVERDGDDLVTKSKLETEGQTGFPYLGVKSVKMLRDTCS